MIKRENIIGIVIAGGQSTRMGGVDKTLQSLGDKTIIETVIDNLGAQIDQIAINTNSKENAFTQMGKPVFPDTLTGFQGPLAGLLASMRWAQENAETATHIVTVAGDSPFFPHTMVNTMIENAPDANTIIMAESAGFNHPVFALWPISLCDDLQKWLDETGVLKVMAWVRTQKYVFVDFPLTNDLDAFFNINTPEDLSTARRHMKEWQK